MSWPASAKVMSLLTPPAWIVAFVAHLDAAEPGGSAPVHGPDVQVVAVADHPDRSRASQCAVASQGRVLDRLAPQERAAFLRAMDMLEAELRDRGQRMRSGSVRGPRI